MTVTDLMAVLVVVIAVVGGGLVGYGYYRVDKRRSRGSASAPGSTRLSGRTSRVHLKGVTAAPPGALIPGAVKPGARPTSGIRIERRAENCPYCRSPVLATEQYVRCTANHLQHRECLAAAGGRCVTPHCTAPAAVR